jgi:hypothetical protein
MRHTYDGLGAYAVAWRGHTHTRLEYLRSLRVGSEIGISFI